ncbi:MAG: hypothetical protein H7235_05305 [Bdellovibrionaceae bacterium]|nr:hypothetical protein [Pseudobdellovibrionaceae bacterium]
MTISKIILCTILAALLASCGQSTSKTAINNGTTVDGGGNNAQPIPETFTQLKEEEIQRECSASEVQSLKSYEQLIQGSNTLVDATKGKVDTKVIAAGVSAIQACDHAIEKVVNAGACRMTKTTIAGIKVAYYDGYRIDEKCKITEKYLIDNDARPPKNNPAVEPPPVVVPTNPHPEAPVVVIPPAEQLPLSSGSLRQCTADEFSNLTSSMSSVDLATAQISKQGESSSWKYDSDTIANASLATKSCEALIAYHEQSACGRTVTKADGSKNLRQYTGAYLRQRCEKARTYFYEFVQNQTTLNFKNADLYIDVSNFETKSFEADYINEIQGCRVENRSGHSINYAGAGQVLVKNSRGFEAKMMVLETNDGLVIQCYGLNIDGPFSKREVVKVLREEGTNMPLSYKLK